jgi:L-lactate dehydrogenase complex protein LldG
MADARQAILEAIRRARGGAWLPEAEDDHPENRLPQGRGGIEDFIRELEALSGQVVNAGSAGEAAEAVIAVCLPVGCREVFAWDFEAIGCPGLGEALHEAGILVKQGGALKELALIGVGITGAEAGLADTGTIVVRNQPSQPPLASLLPPTHIVLLHKSRIFPDMRSYLNSLERAGGAAEAVKGTSNLVFISGPSRTADIEQSLTLGVHGPKTLAVVLWE